MNEGKTDESTVGEENSKFNYPEDWGVLLFLGGVGVLINEFVEVLENALRCPAVSSAERVTGYGGV
mgnify:CR=1 FL=1